MIVIESIGFPKMLSVRYTFLFSCFIYSFVLTIFSCNKVIAQSTKFSVNTSGSIEDIVKSLEGPGVTISNIDYSGDVTNNPVGSFDDVLGLLDVKKGLLMTSGSAKLAIGPNNKSNAGAGNKTPILGNDTDLESLIPDEDLYDVFTIEFDIEVTNNVLSFNYMFGSEEYPEFEREYNDVFGFFISEVGSGDKKNLAVLANGTPISVKSINSQTNNSYYVSNGGGGNPAHDFYLQYDSFTKKLTATTEVIPCKRYHIKLAIADARDDILDSGVFIEEGSFTSTSKLDIELAFEHEGFGYAVEGCNKGYFIVNKNLDWIKESDAVTYEFKLSGTADEVADYKPSIKKNGKPNEPLVGNTITIDAGEKSTTIEIDALLDDTDEVPETVQLDILLRCDGNIIATASSVMIIKDSIDYPINSIVCKDVLMPINTDASDRWEFEWVANDSLVFTGDCAFPTCPRPSVQLSSAAQFPVHAKDSESGCETTTTAFVTIKELHADFNYFKDVNYTTADAYFKNLSVGAETYEWNFGDGETSDVFEPHHYYKTGESLDPVTYKINLKVTSLQGLCIDEHDTTIVVVPFYLQNVITPNNDIWNQQFAINGIEPGFWKMDIYNRWGVQVFSSNAYMNDWEGNGVNPGIYYFKLKNPPGDREFKGWIQVLK